jgi:autotransporter-associated beta strand protein
MKSKSRPFLAGSRPAFAALLGLSGSAWAATNSWNTTTGTWDTTAANWSSPTTWTNGDDAVFSNTGTASTITFSSALTAGSVVIGGGTNNANYTFTNGIGGSLAATTFRVQGAGGNDPGTSTYPLTTLDNASLSLSGDLGVGRARLVIGGTSTVTADRIGGAGIGGIASADWGQVTIQDSANVTATNGIVGGTTAWGLNLNGGTLTTRGINYGPHSWGTGSVNLNFNGTLVRANQDNADFITTTGGTDFAPLIQAGGAKFDTNGFTIGIGVALQGTGALTKSGSGTLNLNTANSYSGGTTINGGTLSMNHEPSGIANTAIGAMTSSNTVTINSGGVLTSDGLRNNWLGNTGLASGGGNAISVVVNQGGTLKGGSGRVTGLGNVTLNGGTIEVTNGLGAFGWNASFSLGGDITVSGSTASAITTSSGSGSTANLYMANGSNGTGGTRTFTVNDVTGSAASDLVVSAQLARGTVIKAGAGTLELATGATGTETPVSWQVNNGRLLVKANVTTGAVTVGSGASLGGSGTVGALTIDAGGTLAPGNSPGVLSTGTYNQAGTLSLELNGLGAGTAHDQLAVTGSVTLSGLLSATVGYTPVNDQLLFILLNDGEDAINGTFSGLAQGSTVTFGGFDWRISYSADSTASTFTGGNDIALLAVPEPGAALLGGLGLLALLRRRRA